MAYQETTTTGYGTRVGNSFKGILTGLLMFVAGTALLWWNEGRTVHDDDATQDAYDATQILSDINTINPAQNGQMVHATGIATTSDILTDDVFGVSENAIRLNREVQYYQWVERSSSKSENKLGGSQVTTTTYNYEMKWVDEPINSSAFKDSSYKGKNTVIKVFPEEQKMAQNVTFGAFSLPQSLIRQISGEEPVAINASPSALSSLKSNIHNANITVSGNTIYIGANPDSPAVGDVKITFTKTNPSNQVTVWAVQNGNSFSSYVHKNGNTVCDLSMGIRSLDEVKQSADDANDFIKWILRFIGVLIIYFGLSSLFDLIVTLLKLIPFLSSVANVGTTFVSVILTLVWSLLIIALAWIFYRPILAIVLLVITGILIFFLVKRSKEKSAK